MTAVALHEPAIAASRADLGNAFLQREPRTMDTHPQSARANRKVSCDSITWFFAQIEARQQFGVGQLKFSDSGMNAAARRLTYILVRGNRLRRNNLGLVHVCFGPSISRRLTPVVIGQCVPQGDCQPSIQPLAAFDRSVVAQNL